MNQAFPLLALFSGCLEYRVKGADGDAASGDSAPLTGSCSALNTGASGPASEATCSGLGEVEWGIQVEDEWVPPTGVWQSKFIVASVPGVEGARVVAGNETELYQLAPGDEPVPLAPCDSGGLIALASVDGFGTLLTCTDIGDFGYRAKVLSLDSGTYAFGPESSDEPDVGYVFRDVDGDGVADIVTDHHAFAGDATVLGHFAGPMMGLSIPAVADLNADGNVEVVNTLGISDALSGELTPWGSGIGGNTFLGGVVLDGEDARILGIDGLVVFLADAAGDPLWTVPGVSAPQADVAIADATGDGLADICTFVDGAVTLLGLDGVVERSWPRSGLSAGGCTMADLDADGVYEVLVLDPVGFAILDGRDGSELASDDEFTTTLGFDAPIVADIDDDGSADVVILGKPAGTGKYVIRALGAASGRWARTRSAWPESGYVASAFVAGGVTAPWPANPWETDAPYRAQPSYDGDRPDLSLTVTDSCHDAAGWHLAVQAQNAGSADAPPGATIEVVSHQDGAFTVLGSVDLGAIPAGTTAEGVVLDLPEPGSAGVFARIVGGFEDCDPQNNRIRIDP